MARYRTTVADLNVLVALAAAGVGLAVVPRRAVDPGGPRTCASCRTRGPAVTTCWRGACGRAAQAFAGHLRRVASMSTVD